LDVVASIITEDEEKDEVLGAPFTSVLNSQGSFSWVTQPPDLNISDKEQNKCPRIQEENVSDLLLYLDCHNSIGPVGIREQKKTAEVIDKPLSLIYYHTWSTGEVPDNWRLDNVTSIYKKEQKESPGNYRHVSPTLCLTPIYRRERRFFDICIPNVRLRNNSSNGDLISLLQILTNQGDGEGEAGNYC